MKSFKKAAPAMGVEQFVRYAGVVGDFNPVHYDLNTAKSFKMPAVIGQGPLVMTLALDAAIAEEGLNKIKGIKARITAPAFPDTPMTVACDEAGKVSVSGPDSVMLKGEIIPR